MARTALTLTIFSALLVVTSFAGPAPKLEKTLAAQYELIEQTPYEAEAHNDLGNLLLLVGRDRDAEQAYRRAVELGPQSTAARFNLAVLLQQKGWGEEAGRELQSLLEIDPYHGWAHYQLGMLHEQNKDRSKALESYARAFAYDPALTFATNNPHIIDNELSTEALLLSQRYRTSAATRVPRHYSNPHRIAELMLLEMEAEAAGENQEGESEGTDEEGPGTEENGDASDEEISPRASRSGSNESDRSTSRRGSPGSTASMRDTGSLPLRRGGSSDEDQNRVESSDPATLLVATPQSRVLTPQSVDEVGRRNQAAPPPPAPPGSREARRQAFEQRFLARSSRSSSKGSAASDSSTSAPPPSTPRGSARYRPGRASSGRLEFELLPAEPVERYAASQRARG